MHLVDKETEKDRKLEKAAETTKNLDQVFDLIRNPPKDQRSSVLEADSQRHIDAG